MHKHTIILISIIAVYVFIFCICYNRYKEPKQDRPFYIDLPEEWRVIGSSTVLKGKIINDTLYIEFAR